MSSPNSPTLQQLDHLDSSSTDFHNQLCNVLHGEEYSRCMPNLQGDDLVRLVDYLDKVRRRRVTFPNSPLKLAQALDNLDPSGPAFRKCLRELRNRCSAGGILPTSYTLSLTFSTLVPSRSRQEVVVMSTRGPLTVQGFASNV